MACRFVGAKPLSEPMMECCRNLTINFSEILSGIHTFSFKKMHVKMLSVKWLPFCLDLNVFSVAASWPRTITTLLTLCEMKPSITVRIPHKISVMQSFGVSFIVSLKRLLIILQSCQSYKRCHVTLMRIWPIYQEKRHDFMAIIKQRAQKCKTWLNMTNNDYDNWNYLTFSIHSFLVLYKETWNRHSNHLRYC